MKLLLALTATSAVVIAAPVAAQSSAADNVYFSGPYISGSFNGDFVDDSGDERLIFDPQNDGDFQFTLPTAAGANAFSPGYCGGEAFGRTPQRGCADDDAGIGGSIRLGYDARIGSFGVAGLMVEGSLGDTTDYTTGFSTTPASYTFIREVKGSAALRGRIGISPGDGRGLFYATGGVVYGKIDHDFVTTNGANAFEVLEGDDWQLGGQIGMGAELHVLDNVTFGVEFLHTRYDDDDNFVRVTQGTAPLSNPFVRQGGTTNLALGDPDLKINSFRATVGFHF